MWKESSSSELVQELHGKSGGISRITCTVSTGKNVASQCKSCYELMALISSTEPFNDVSIAPSAIQRSTVAQEHGSYH